MLITISGLSGCGKSTAAKRLSEKLGIHTVDVGEIFRDMAKRHNMDVMAFGKYAEEHPEIDRELDEAMMERAKLEPDLILQGRLAGWMAKRHNMESYRIWLDASPETRAQRMAYRENLTLEESLKNMNIRDEGNRTRYKALYGLDLNDLSVYDTVVRTDNQTIEEVVAALLKALMHVWPKNSKMTPQ